MYKYHSTDETVSQSPLAELDAIASQHKPLKPVAEMVRSGHGALYIAKPHHPLENVFCPDLGNVLLIIADDYGPASFPGLKEALALCDGCFILEGNHTGAYHSATLVARMGGKAAVIECNPSASADWLKLAQELDLSTCYIMRAEGRA